MAALSAASSASAASEVEAYWRNPFHRKIHIMEYTLKTITNKGHQFGLIEIDNENIEKGTKLGQGRILLSDLLDLIYKEFKLDERKEKPKFLIVACRTIGGVRIRASINPNTYDLSERVLTDENSYILIEGHGTEQIVPVKKDPDKKDPESFTYDKADLYFRAQLGHQCRKKDEWPEEYDSFMSCATMVEKYPQTITNPFIDIHELRISKRYMTTKMDFKELKKQGTIAGCYKEIMNQAIHPDLKRRASVGQPSTPHGIPTSNSTPNSPKPMPHSTSNSMPNPKRSIRIIMPKRPKHRENSRETKTQATPNSTPNQTPNSTGNPPKKQRTTKGGTVKRKPRKKKGKTRRRP